jgi:hypothetical protein
MFNGIDVLQTRDYIKIDCHTYINKFCEKNLNTWLSKVPLTENRPTPLPTDATWIKKFNAAVGPFDPHDQKLLATKMQLKYKAGIGKLIWAMTTCRPDIAFTSVKLHNPILPRLNTTTMVSNTPSGTYTSLGTIEFFWKTCSWSELPEGPLPTVNSNHKDLLLNDCPDHNATTAVAYGDDSD